MRYRESRKPRYFVGRAPRSLDSIYLNLTRKSWSRIIRAIFFSYGDLRNYSRNCNQHNAPSGIFVLTCGRLDVEHTKDEVCHMGEHKTVFLVRSFCECSYSFLNHMLIGSRRAASGLFRTSIKEKELPDRMRRLKFTAQNPLGRSLSSEYERFFGIDVRQHDFVLTYDDFKSAHVPTVPSLAEFLSPSSGGVSENIEGSLSADTWARNQRRKDIFATIQPCLLTEIGLQIGSADQFSVYFE